MPRRAFRYGQKNDLIFYILSAETMIERLVDQKREKNALFTDEALQSIWKQMQSRDTNQPMIVDSNAITRDILRRLNALMTDILSTRSGLWRMSKTMKRIFYRQHTDIQSLWLLRTSLALYLDAWSSRVTNTARQRSDDSGKTAMGCWSAHFYFWELITRLIYREWLWSVFLLIFFQWFLFNWIYIW